MSQAKHKELILKALFERGYENEMAEICTHTERFFVYQNAYRLRVLEALSEAYPQSFAILEQMELGAFIEDYIKLESWVGFDLGLCAAEFPNFLARHQDLKSYPLVSVLARLEALRLSAFHAPAVVPGDLQSFAKQLETQGGSLGFAAAEGVKLMWIPRLASDQNLHSFELAELGPTESGELLPLVIYRQDYQAKSLVMDSFEGQFFFLLLKRGSLDQLATVGSGLDFALLEGHIAEWLFKWVGLGLVKTLPQRI